DGAASPVPMANSGAPWVSPTKRMPSGPTVRGPADFRSGFPCLRLAVGSAPSAIAAVREIPASTIAVTRIPNLDIGGSPSLWNPSTPDETERLPPKTHYRHNPRGINEVVREIRSFPGSPSYFPHSGCRKTADTTDRKPARG